MAVDFVAPAAAASVTATFGTPAKNAPVNCVQQALNKYAAQWCTAVFGGLEANTAYTYSLVADGKAFTANFTNQPSRDPVFALYADFGLGCVGRKWEGRRGVHSQTLTLFPLVHARTAPSAMTSPWRR